MVDQSFFDESKEQSLVKAEIVAKYFWAWAKVIIPQAKKWNKNIAYIDLFSGPGRYKDGSKSTPLLILERAINDPEMQKILIAFFNDIDSNNINSLKKEIERLPNVDDLKYKPIISNTNIGEEITEIFEQNKLTPSLFFIDPWGYKGLSIRLIGAVIKNWGCDCIFFFNYNRINMGINNQAVESHLNALFGETRANELRNEIITKNPEERELLIVESISQALKEIGGQYVLPFGFKNEKGSRTSHHLIFVSKHIKGYEIMKEIMAKESSNIQQGVASFEYNIAPPKYPLLYQLQRPLDEMAEQLLEDFAGQTIKMIDIYNNHHIGTRYIKRNYKEALLSLESSNKITTSYHKKNTFADNVIVTFPPKQ
jgi:three-Cys-motif partner protein